MKNLNSTNLTNEKNYIDNIKEDYLNKNNITLNNNLELNTIIKHEVNNVNINEKEQKPTQNIDNCLDVNVHEGQGISKLKNKLSLKVKIPQENSNKNLMQNIKQENNINLDNINSVILY